MHGQLEHRSAVSGRRPLDWSTGVVPTSSDNACVKVAGTYKVTLEGDSQTDTVSVGRKSGRRPCRSTERHVRLGAFAHRDNRRPIRRHRALKLKAQNVAGSGSTLIGGGGGVTIANSGTFQTSGGKDSPIYLRVNVANGSGAKTKINGITTEDGSGGATTLTNKGTFSVGANGSLTLTNGSSFTQSTRAPSPTTESSPRTAAPSPRPRAPTRATRQRSSAPAP